MPYLAMVLVFVVINLLVFALSGKLGNAGVDTTVLLVGNLVLFLIFLVSLLLHLKTVGNQSTHVFMRNVYSGMLLKLFGGATAAFVYIYLARDGVNKPALFACMFLYFLYTILELRVVLSKTKSS